MELIERIYTPAERRCLSAHELATLLVLLQTPVDARAATEDVLALREAGLARLVDSKRGEAKFAITDEGNAVLRMLDAG
ncbi:hypothetical protein PQR68_20515 [Paraburkholderia agricolaris]|jgi:hypothetical protein|uniref:Preprotein translocase subunit SecA n=1 Tax=Paraburkholderia agricolaris TaxID=2152888 RepID=A0ABW8ZP23_9BURK